jgi:hypothetical protein
LRDQANIDLDLFLNTDDFAELMVCRPRGGTETFSFTGLRSGNQPTAGGDTYHGSSSLQRILCRRSVMRAGYEAVEGTARDPQPGDQIDVDGMIITLHVHPETEGATSDACWLTGTVSTLDALSVARRT